MESQTFMRSYKEVKLVQHGATTLIVKSALTPIFHNQAVGVEIGVGNTVDKEEGSKKIP
jgi:hypothetical protein